MTTGARDKPATEGGSEFSVATAPANARHRQLALAVIATTILGYVLIAAYAAIPLPRVDSFIPTVYAIIFITDLVTAVLLFAQFSATGSRPLLVLAGGYLFSSLIVVAHALTFPGAFAPTGLLDAGFQSSAWLNVMWRLGLGAAIALYAGLRSGTVSVPTGAAPRSAIVWTIAIVSVLVLALTFAATAGHDLLPPLLSTSGILPLGRVANGVIALTNLIALLLLLKSTRGKTILDLWLIVAALALLAESTMVTFVISARYTLGFYALRLISVPVSKVVLVVLLWETIRLYANLAIANQELRRERANRLTNAAMGLAAIAHEIRQPLTGIGLTAAAGRQVLDQPSPDIGKAKAFFTEIKEGAARASDVFVAILRLLKGEAERRVVDVNAVTREATLSLRKELEEHGVVVTTQLAADLPVVHGDSGQLREVILNLIQTSIDTMAPTAGRPREISIETARLNTGGISISVQDSGPGIEPHKLASIFDPYVTTKESGSGLGLAICKMIVEHHGGVLSAGSDDGGARYSITLPTGAA